MQNLQNTLIELLKDDTLYTSAGKLLKNKLTEDALKLESSLLKYLINNDRLKKHFFINVESTLVFDKDKFIQFVNDKEFLPDSYTSFRNKIGLLDEDGKYFSEKRDVVLAWPYKDCVLEGGQDKEDQKRNEIFYNEVLAPDEIDRLFDPKVLTNFKRYDKDGEHKNPEDLSRDDNLIIKGNNLLALHSLKKMYRGKVKLIYIDPPYNTGNDSFGYNDKFNHSTWLTFMKTRLLVAKELLSNNGVIFVHMDYNESHYCKLLLDDIFGKDKFQNEIIWRRKQATSYGKSKFGIVTDSILFYSNSDEYDFFPIFSRDDENTKKYIKERFIYDDGDGRKYMKSPLVNSLYRPNLKYVFQGINPPENGWLYSKEKMQKLFDNNELIIPDNSDSRIYRRIFLDEYKGQVIQSLWTDIPIVNPMAKERVDFDTQKPEKLIHRIITSTTNENDLVLDFVAGSGTTLATAMKMNRIFIGVEQMDYVNSVTIDRLTKVINGDKSGISESVDWQGGGSFIYAELKKWNQNYIDEIEDAKTPKKLLTIYKKMKDEAFFRYDVDLSQVDKNEFSKLELDQQKEVLIECLDKNHLYVNLSEIDDATYDISDEDKAMNKKFYGLDR